jgi:hypothetical protein
MKAKVLHLLTTPELQEPLILFETEFGTAIARWHGDKPVAEETYHVELGIDDILVWGESIRPAAEQQAKTSRATLFPFEL